MEWARGRLAAPLRISRLANPAAKSELRRFQDGVGMTPMAWLQRERMFRAHELLEASDQALRDIAGECG
jgi:AraC family transcriptional activator FtrA